MELTEKEISEIAENLECGMICYFHRETGEIESHPDPNDMFFDPEPWQEVLDKIEQNFDDYVELVPMTSFEQFRVMEDFAHSLTDINFKYQVFAQQEKKKPFRNFKQLIDCSEYRQNWFDFRKQANIDSVKEQIRLDKIRSHQ